MDIETVLYLEIGTNTQYQFQCITNFYYLACVLVPRSFSRLVLPLFFLTWLPFHWRMMLVFLPCQSPPAWPSSPSRSCWGAGCRRRTAPPSACPGQRRWGGSPIPSRRLVGGRQDRDFFFWESVWPRILAWRVSRLGVWLTGLADAQDFTQNERELDAAAGKRTLVFVFPAAVLQDKLGKQ